jgi:hypothetical protein
MYLPALAWGGLLARGRTTTTVGPARAVETRATRGDATVLLDAGAQGPRRSVKAYVEIRNRY